MNEEQRIKAGDCVFHKPSGEEWYVLGVDYGRGKLCVAGWPHTIAEISDCILTERGRGITDEERTGRARMFGTDWEE